jgi:30S ribosomal protein S31
MGKGDKRTAKGKRFAGSYGKARPKAKTKAAKSGTKVATKTTATKTTATKTTTKKK